MKTLLIVFLNSFLVLNNGVSENVSKITNKVEINKADNRLENNFGINSVYVDDNVVSGIALKDSKVELYIDGVKIDESYIDNSGIYHFIVEDLVLGSEIKLKNTKQGYQDYWYSCLVKPLQYFDNNLNLDQIYLNDKTLTGQSVSGANIKVLNNDVLIGQTIVGEDNKFSVVLNSPIKGSKIVITATKDGYVDGYFTLKVNSLSKFSNSVDGVNLIAKKITGKTSPYTTVKLIVSNKVIKTTTSDRNGNFSININPLKAGTSFKLEFSKRGFETTSQSFSVLNVHSNFSVNTITSKSTNISGKTTPNSTIKVYKNNTLIASSQANSSGNFKVVVSKQSKNTNLTFLVEKQGYEALVKNIQVK